MHTEIEKLVARYKILQPIAADIEAAYQMLCSCFTGENKLYVAGNGGSAADAEHICGELLKGFLSRRAPGGSDRDSLLAQNPALAEKLQDGLQAIPLTGFMSLRTAFANDVDPVCEFAQLLWVLGRKDDVFWAISTSGNAVNILAAVDAARARGMKIIAMTGSEGGKLAAVADIAIKAPDERTHIAQEYHLPIYHCLCIMLEQKFFPYK